ncbi:hypothetical protein GCM10023310_46070 [Paenibacillus vulneris]
MPHHVNDSLHTYLRVDHDKNKAAVLSLIIFPPKITLAAISPMKNPDNDETTRIPATLVLEVNSSFAMTTAIPVINTTSQ